MSWSLFNGYWTVPRKKVHVCRRKHVIRGNRSHLDDPYWARYTPSTGVFRDVVDFPIVDCDAYLISKYIKSALKNKGCYDGLVSMFLYEDDKNKYEAAGISINFVPQKNLKEELTETVIRSLYMEGYNFVLAEPVKLMPCTESSAWLWDSLCRSLSSDGSGSSQ
ncbi:hypothetical protein CARUB_v10003805mg [Capsella rubella]|uniref:Uncharacterized protein n=1 Tax=Capsella rubella TaxID=81985 RepID=R0FKT0_9BRAS|nr:hypothetical protein CARUB_v10003805mg [Capsella rubella]